MYVECNQLTGMPVSTDVADRAIEIAGVLEGLDADTIQIAAQRLGFEKTKGIVSEMLRAMLPEEAVAVAMDHLQAEFNRPGPEEQTPVKRMGLFLED